MKSLILTTICLIWVLAGCTHAERVLEDDIAPSVAIEQGKLEYLPIEPVHKYSVKIYDPEQDTLKVVYWDSLPDSSKVHLLPVQSAQVSVAKTNLDGELSYLSSAISQEKGSYTVIMDYMKYRVEHIYNSAGETDSIVGNAKIGIGLRIRAQVNTSRSNLNLGSLLGLGIEAKRENLSGSISVDVIGIDSKDVTHLIPLTSEIDQTSIQSALQALASIKTKIYDDETRLTPHIVAVTNVPFERQDEAIEKAAGE
jgi:hypothetical protein